MGDCPHGGREWGSVPRGHEIEEERGSVPRGDDGGGWSVGELGEMKLSETIISELDILQTISSR